MLRTFILLAVLLSSKAWAAEWELVDKNKQVSEYIDRASQTRELTVYTAWLKSVYAEPQKPILKAAITAYTQKLELVRMNCAKRSYSITKTIYNDKHGKQAGSENGTASNEPVIPDSPSELRRAAMCGKRYTSFQALSDQGIYYRALDEPKPGWNPFAK